VCCDVIMKCDVSLIDLGTPHQYLKLSFTWVYQFVTTVLNKLNYFCLSYNPIKSLNRQSWKGFQGIDALAYSGLSVTNKKVAELWHLGPML
jgi:hypothetical protein